MPSKQHSFPVTNPIIQVQIKTDIGFGSHFMIPLSVEIRGPSGMVADASDERWREIDLERLPFGDGSSGEHFLMAK